MGQAEPRYRALVPTVREQPDWARYTLAQSGAGSKKADFAAASSWQQGPAPFTDNPGEHGTTWTGGDLWGRRTVRVPDQRTTGELRLLMEHDDDVEVYLNGMLLTRQTGFNSRYDFFAIPPFGRARWWAATS